MAILQKEPQTVLDGRIINGRICDSPTSQVEGLTYHSGKIQAAPGDVRTWGTIDASGGRVLPGLVSATDKVQADYLPWCSKGVCTVVAPVGCVAELDALKAATGVVDVVPVLRLSAATTCASVVEARENGVAVFDAGPASPSTVADSLGGCSVRIPVSNPDLVHWVRAAQAFSFQVVITEVNGTTLAQAAAVKFASNARVYVEVASDDLCGGDDLWAAVIDGTIDICSMPGPDSPSLMPLLLNAVAGRGLPFSRISQLTSQSPAAAAMISHRKGTLQAGKDADAVVVGAKTPGLEGDPVRAERINLSLRRGEFLYLQGQIHAKPATGALLRSETKGGC